jgi:hypothetical protein
VSRAEAGSPTSGNSGICWVIFRTPSSNRLAFVATPSCVWQAMRIELLTQDLETAARAMWTWGGEKKKTSFSASPFFPYVIAAL